MQRMSRVQRLLLIYILLELEKPRIIKKYSRAPVSVTVPAHAHDSAYLKLIGGTLTGDLVLNQKDIRLVDGSGNPTIYLNYDASNPEIVVNEVGQANQAAAYARTYAKDGGGVVENYGRIDLEDTSQDSSVQIYAHDFGAIINVQSANGDGIYFAAGGLTLTESGGNTLDINAQTGVATLDTINPMTPATTVTVDGVPVKAHASRHTPSASADPLEIVRIYFDRVFVYTIFESVDNWTAATGGTGAATPGMMNYVMNTGAANGSVVSLRTPDNIIGCKKETDVAWHCKFTSAAMTNQTIAMHCSPTLGTFVNVDQFGFKLVGNTLYATSCDNTANEETTNLGTVAVNKVRYMWAKLNVDGDGNPTSIDFYKSDQGSAFPSSPSATHTTRLPTKTAWIYYGVHITNTAAQVKVVAWKRGLVMRE